MARIYTARTVNEVFCHHGMHVGSARNGRDIDGYVAPAPEVLRLQSGKKPVDVTPAKCETLPAITKCKKEREIVQIRPTVVKRKLS